MSFTLYNQKRDFENTPEPQGKKGAKSKKLSFVVQRHYASHLHYDFRLELEGVLKSWAIPKGPSMNPGDKRLAVAVEDHPLPYGKFYGEIPQGNYGAGNVEIWDNGTYQTLEESKNEEETLLTQFEKGDLKFILKGTHLKGAFALVRMNDGKDKNWLLIKKKDDYAVENFEINSITSLKSKQKKKSEVATVKTPTVSKIKKSIPKKTSFPTELPKPMLAKLSQQIVNHPDWIYEMKYDGYRVISQVSNEKANLFSRNGNSFTKIFKSLTLELNTIKDAVVLDGEVVIENENGLSNFQMLQNYQSTQEGILKYFVFDMTYLNGFDIIRFPLIKRKELLKSFFENYNFENIYNSEYQIGNGKKLFDELSVKENEGIIAIVPESAYLEGKRVDSWLKIKTSMMQEACFEKRNFYNESFKGYRKL